MSKFLQRNLVYFIAISLGWLFGLLLVLGFNDQMFKKAVDSSPNSIESTTIHQHMISIEKQDLEVQKHLEEIKECLRSKKLEKSKEPINN